MIGSIFSGLIVGILARFLKPGADGMGWIMTIILGIAGAFVGGKLATTLGLSAEGGFMGLAISVVGAIILLFIYELITGKNR
ncbi:GlsB/YeaQ/YmgE family stress response membrane protein [Psychrobacter sp. HD31]|uniref:GlsB/YeaQ/YmgE family stress response membrane protein n=1 Tax=Psychrobacter sp. HD31 TaxID=3112003 RepID=UPI003DA2CC8C